MKFMKLSRRDFFKLTGATIGGTALMDFSFSEATAEEVPLRIRYAQETPSICPYCSVGCGIIAHTEGGRLINTEGDPNHPINQGALCSKGNAVYQVVNNPRRLTRVLYRAPGAADWEEKSWEWALDRISSKLKQVRDQSWINTEKIEDKEYRVNRTDAIAILGGAAHNNEEAYLITKLSRLLGVVNLEHQARI